MTENFCEPTEQQLKDDLARVGKAVLSKRERVEPTQAAWRAELEWRAMHMGTSMMEQAINEIIRMHHILTELTKPKEETPV